MMAGIPGGRPALDLRSSPRPPSRKTLWNLNWKGK
jgi:hypothetical protein